MKTFFRVQNLTNEKDFTDFDNIDDAREFCEEWSLTEDTHELQKWEPNKKSSHVDVQMSFFFRNDQPVGALIQKAGDDSYVCMIAAMNNPHAAGKVQHEKRK